MVLPSVLLGACATAYFHRILQIISKIHNYKVTLSYKISKLHKISFLCFPPLDSLSSGDDEDYDDYPEDAGNENGEFF